MTQLAEYTYCPMPVIEGTGVIQIQISADGKKWSEPYNINIIGKLLDEAIIYIIS